jgi:hypothetical protein
MPVSVTKGSCLTDMKQDYTRRTAFSVNPLMRNLIKIRTDFFEMKHVDGHTDMTSALFVHFMNFGCRKYRNKPLIMIFVMMTMMIMVIIVNGINSARI